MTGVQTCALPISLGVLLLIFWWRDGKAEVRAFDNGIAYTANGSVQNFRWDDISEVYERSVSLSINFVPIARVQRYILNTTDGRISLDGNIQDVGELGRYVQEQTFAKKIPLAIEAHEAGKILRFGPLSLQRQKGIWHGKAFLPWQYVKSVDVVDGYIRIIKYGKWFSWAKVSVASVPNHLIFLAVVGQPQAFTVNRK